jgi:microcystin-dependent protein
VIGQVIAYVTTFPPANVLPCDGTTYLRVDYQSLYEVLDTAFIVDADHFRVPDLRGRTIIGAGQGTGLTNRSVDDAPGQEAVVLTEGELAEHSHTNTAHSHTDTGHVHSEIAGVPVVVFEGVVPIPGGASVAFPSTTGIGFAGITASQVAIDATGNGDAHENMQPSLALNYGLIAR